MTDSKASKETRATGVASEAADSPGVPPATSDANASPAAPATRVAAARVEAPDPSQYRAVHTALVAWGAIAALFGIGGIALAARFQIHPSVRAMALERQQWFAVVVVALLSLSVAGLVGALSKPRPRAYFWAKRLLIPWQLAALFLMLQFGTVTEVWGGGLALGVFGFAGLLLARNVLLVLRRPVLVQGVAAALQPTGTGLGNWLAERFLRRVTHERRTIARAGPPHALRDNLEAIVIALILALVIRTFAVEAFKIPTGSMLPAVRGVWYDYQDRRHDGDKILVNKFIYNLRPPARWDIIVFKYPLNESRNFIKRLTGLPEEQLLFWGGDLWRRPILPVSRASLDLNRDGRLDDDERRIGRVVLPLPGGPAPNPKAPETVYVTRDDPANRWTICRKPPEVMRRLWRRCLRAGSFELQGEPDAPGFTPTGAEAVPVLEGAYYDWPAPPPQAAGEWRLEGSGSGRTLVVNAGDAPALAGFTRQVRDTFPLAKRPEDQVHTSPPSLHAFGAGGEYEVGDLRIVATVTLNGPAAELHMRLHRNRESIRLRLAANGQASLVYRLDPEGSGVVVEHRPTDASARLLNLADEIRRRQIRLAPDTPLRVDFGVSDNEAVLDLDGVGVLRWQLPAPPPPTDPNPTEFNPVENTWIKVGGRAGTVRLAGIELFRDIFYFPAPARDLRTLYTIPPDRFFVCGDNQPSSKDSRLWYQLQFDDEAPEGSRRRLVEPDPEPVLFAGPDGQEGNALIGRTSPAELAIDPRALTAVIRSLPAETAFPVADHRGVVFPLLPGRMRNYVVRRTPFVPRRNIVGRALLRFWPVDDMRFLK